MGMATIPGNIKYVFTQEATPSGEGEVSGSLWYKPSTKVLSTYDGLAWNNVSIVSDSGEGHITIKGINYNAIISTMIDIRGETRELKKHEYQFDDDTLRLKFGTNFFGTFSEELGERWAMLGESILFDEVEEIEKTISLLKKELLNIRKWLCFHKNEPNRFYVTYESIK